MVRSGGSRSKSAGTALEFRLRAESTEVDVRLKRFGDRWIAFTESAGDKEIGLSATPRGALGAAVRQLRPRAASALLADLQLLDVSLRLA